MSQMGKTSKKQLTSKFQDNQGFLQFSALMVKAGMFSDTVG